MRFRLPTLLLLLAISPPLLWGAFWVWQWAITFRPEEGELIVEEWIIGRDGKKTQLPPAKK